MATPGGSDLSQHHYNGLLSDAVDMYHEIEDGMMRAVFADGAPPFATPVGLQQEYETLDRMRLSGDPTYYGNPDAIKRYAALSPRFGYIAREPGLLGGA